MHPAGTEAPGCQCMAIKQSEAQLQHGCHVVADSRALQLRDAHLAAINGVPAGHDHGAHEHLLVGVVHLQVQTFVGGHRGNRELV